MLLTSNLLPWRKKGQHLITVMAILTNYIIFEKTFYLVCPVQFHVKIEKRWCEG